MGNGKKNRGGERVLQSRHVIGLFLLMLLFCSIFFTLGYVMGKSQYETVRAAAGESAVSAMNSLKAHKSQTTVSKMPSPAAQSQPGNRSTAPASSDWDFYHADEAKKSEAHLVRPEETASARSVAMVRQSAGSNGRGSNSRKSGARFGAPLIPGGAVVLQVAAVKRESEALALAQSLQKKRFPVYVLAPGVDHYYRVQVGPYADQQSANVARKGLETAGFRALVKR